MKKQRRKRIAAIDVGTNSFHLIVAEVSPRTGRFHVLDREREHVQLGSGASDMKLLTPAAMNRGLRTLQRFADIARSFRAPVRAVATSAVREASNGADFIRRAEKETGIRVEVASGVEEARLIHLGVLQALPLYKTKILLFDIGGGSTEFLVGKGRKIDYANTLKIGAVRLSRRFFPGGLLSPEALLDCRRFVEGILSHVVRDLRDLTFTTTVATSGTVLSLARYIEYVTEGREPRTLNGFTMNREQLERARDAILSLASPRDRARLPGIDTMRAEILPAGVLILDYLLSALDIREVVVSEYALREGIVRDSLEKSKARRRLPTLTDIQRASVEHTLEQYQAERTHPRQVSRLALAIFDQTERLHSLGAPERNYLEVASLLHELGLHISHTQHHRHSYYLIRHSDIVGYTEREKEMIANIARYHRKSHPKDKHTEFRGLSPRDKDVVRKLSAILRIADGFDRRHRSIVRSVAVRQRGNAVEMSIAASRNAGLDIEIWGAELKKDLFEEVFGVGVTFVRDGTESAAGTKRRV